MIAPPSPVVTVLTGWNEKTVMSACTASPTGPSGRRDAERVRGVLDQHDVVAERGADLGHRRRQPGEADRDHGACVRSLSAAATVSALTLQVAGSMSANRGVAPT